MLPKPSPAPPSLSDHLLAARITFHLLAAPGLPFPFPLPSPLPAAALLRVLRHPRIPAASKLSFFLSHHDASVSSPSSSAAFSALFTSLSSSSPRLLDRLVPLAVASPDHLPSLAASLVSAGRLDAALRAFDAAPPHLLPQLARALLSPLVNASLQKNELGTAVSVFKKFATLGCGIRSSVSAELLTALSRGDRKGQFHDVFDELRRREEFTFDTQVYNVCIHAFGKWGEMRQMLALVNEMKRKRPAVDLDLCTYNTVLRALCRNGRIGDALAVLDEMKGSGHEPDVFTYRAVVGGCCKCFRIDDAIRLLGDMEQSGVGADTVVYNMALDGLFKARRLEEACNLFERMVGIKVPCSIATHNIVLDGLFRNGYGAAGYGLFCDLKQKGKLVDVISYSIVVREFCLEGRVEDALVIAKEMEERGLEVDLVTITSLLIGMHKSGRWDLHDQLIRYVRGSSLLSDVARWKANMEAAMRGPQDKGKDYMPMFPFDGDTKDAIAFVTPDDGGSVEPFPDPKDEWSSSPYLDHLAKHSDHFVDSQTFTLAKGRRVQDTGFETFDIDMVNTYMSIFLSKGKISVACKLFEIFSTLGREATSYTYNSLIGSFVKKGYMKEVWGVLQEMADKSCRGDIATYNLIIQGFGKMEKAEVASAVLDQLLKQGGNLDVVMYNTLINALGKGGKLEDADRLFEQMMMSNVNPDIVTYNTLVDVHAKACNIKEAYKYLRRMLASGCAPNHVTDTILDFLGKEINSKRHASSIEKTMGDPHRPI